MKKVALVSIGIIILAVVCIYIFIPSTLIVNSVSTLHGTAAGISRALHKKETWNKVWQEGKQFTKSDTWDSSDFFWQGQDTFHFGGLLQNAIKINIADRSYFLQSQLTVFSIAPDSSVLQWNYSIPTSANPLKRLEQYRQAVDTKKGMTIIIEKLKRFLSDDRNIYGFTIAQVSTKDTFLISTRSITDTYPSTEHIYQLIDKLQIYAKKKAALQTGYPMINVTNVGKGYYSIMIALPVNKKLDDQGEIIHKQMVLGRFLTTTVIGGTEIVNNAYLQLQQYFQDYDRTSMAIPFMYLITDRSQEKDSSKWITKIYFPVM